jgi:tyrosyl-tRNA synthetase
MSSQFLPVDEQLAILKRGIVDFEVEAELKTKLERSRKENKPLTIKAGFDPTAPDLHLGHGVLLNKMRQFQELGHRVVFLIGDFTARIGDPTGKNTTRPPLTDEAITVNAATYKRQVFKLLDSQKTVVLFNSEWLASMSFDDIIRLAARYSVARIIEREDFRRRLSEGRHISMHELLYPLVQGYDSVAMRADVELGGTDQRFNLLVGRDLMRHYGIEPQCIMTVPILEGLDAREVEGKIVGDKMSKSLGNYIGFEEEPDSQFGKIMSVCDPVMWRYYDLLSARSNAEIATLKAGHPKEAKLALAFEIVERFHTTEAAEKALANFHALFGAGKQGEVPTDAPEISLPWREGLTLSHMLVETQLVESGGDAKRLIRQGGVSLDGNRVDDVLFAISPGKHLVRAGKKKWAQVTVISAS